MDWEDEGLLLDARHHGESSMIIHAFTQVHGVVGGVVRGGASTRKKPMLSVGNQLSLRWRARLQNQLGTLQVEPLRSRAAAIMESRLSLAAGAAVTALLADTLPERLPYPALFTQSVALLDLIGQPDWAHFWPLAYLQWEMSLLRETGFGLDLSRCAVTGATADLCYVSPKSGRAVSGTGAGDWADRLLPLPAVMRGEGDAPRDEIITALTTTGWFLQNRLHDGKPLPAARGRLLDAFGRQNG
ncbi:DNA repair protein RecO [Ketogulonicigenium robustum]|uniref:DNA repair protein RecO n=1 Tax=Ketogulonicigenium robustum TaxID=92947 RepID=UPI0018DC4073|nr:DNA repair protein RecO [Ketogulonicigenium robustum]